MPIEIINDVGLIPQYILLITYLFLVLFTSIMAHELGHLLYFYIHKKKKVRLRFFYHSLNEFGFETGMQEDYDDLSNQDYVQVNGWAVILGLIPIAFSMIYVWWSWLMIFPYGIGCKQDLQEMWKYREDD